MQIEVIIKQIPEWQKLKSIRYEVLSGGYSNTIYKVFADEKIYALRINGEQNKYLGLKYEDEIKVMALAAEDNLTPSVLQCPNKTDYLITEFIEGTTFSVEQMNEPENLKKIVELLKKIHSIPYTGKRSSTPFSLTRRSLQGAEKLGIRCPAELAGFLKEMDAIEKRRRNDPSFLKHYCHNDPFNHNLMACNDGLLRILDWELSGLGDIWFDLATVSFCSGFDQKTEESLLQQYFGFVDEEKLKTLHDIKFVCMLREIGWALLHTALNRNKPEPGPGFIEFADNVLNRLKQGLVTLV